jgi:hypothetical protein
MRGISPTYLGIYNRLTDDLSSCLEKQSMQPTSDEQIQFLVKLQRLRRTPKVT